MSDQPTQQQKTLRDYLYVVFKHKYLVVIIFLVVIIATLVALLSQPPIYESNAKVLVSSGRTDTLEMVTGTRSQSEIHAELELLHSRGFTEAVVDKIGPETILFKVENGNNIIIKIITKINENILQSGTQINPSKLRENAIKEYRETLSISQASRSEVINFSYFAQMPELAQQILSETIETYMDKHIAMHTTAVSLEFLSDETARLREELENKQEQLRRFQREVDIISFTEQQTLLLESISDLEALGQLTEADIFASEASIENMRNKIDMRELLRGEEIRLESLRARYSVVRGQLKSKRNELARLRRNEKRYLELRNQVDALRDNYDRYFSSLEQARIAQTLENQRISNIGIMQKPTIILEPVSQDKKKKLALGLFVGIVGGLGLAFVTEYFNHKIKTTEDVRNILNIQNVLSIPPVNTARIAQSLRKRAKLERKELLLPEKVMSKNVTVWLYMIPEIRECFESIKSQLYGEMGNFTKERPDNAPYVLGVTSSYRGEGVSSIALGLAYTISLYEGENVLLVDSNLHNPHEEKIIGENRPPGLYEVTVNRSSVTMDVNDEENRQNDSLFSVNNMDEYLSQMDGSQKINKLLPSVEKLNYKVIVIDLPSISEGVATLKSSAISDGVIFVIESEKVRREVLLHAKSKLDNAGVKILGLVLNKRRYYIPKWLYSRL